MKNRLAHCLLLVAGLCLPLVLHGQAQPADTLSSIVGRTFYRMDMGQAAQVSGVEYLDVPLSGVDVVLVAGKDTLRVKTDNQGRFSFSGINIRQVTLSMVNDDYAPFSETFGLMPGENVVIVPRQRKVETLDAATVTAEAPIMTMKGDTLVYHANALTVREGDYAIDLLMQMPGVEVDRMTGTIRISGKNVARSYVNGALVFGLNPMDSMENLRAEQVVTMEVYDEQDPMEVIDRRMREKQRVVNIKTKDPIFSTTDLQVRAIAGMDETKQEDGKPQYRYAAGANAHFFSELVQLYADVIANNVGMNSSNIDATPGPQSTYRGTTDLDLGFNKYWQSPLFGNGLNTRYIFTRQRTRSRRRTLQEYFELAGIPKHDVEEETSSTGLTERHRVESGYAYKTGERIMLIWRQGFSLTRNDTDGRNLGSTVYGGMDPMLRDEVTFNGSKSWSLDETVTAGIKRLKNGKPGPSLTLSVMLNEDNLDSWNLDTLASSYTKRYLTKQGNGLRQNWNGSLSQDLYEYRKDSKRLQLTGNYEIAYNYQNRLQEAYDLYGVIEPVMNIANTYDYTYSTLHQDVYFRLMFSSMDSKIKTGSLIVRVDLDQVKDRERLPAAFSGDKNYFSVMPQLNFATNSYSWGFGATSTRIPAVEQLRRRVNDTNPLALTAGNPDLKLGQVWFFRVAKLRSNPNAKKWMTTWNLNIQVESSPVVQRTIFYREATVLDEYDGYVVPAGASLLRYENADFALNGTLSLNTSARLSLLKGKLRPTVRLQPRLDYRLQPQYFGEVLDRLSEWTPQMNVSVTAPLWVGAQASLTGDAAYIRATSVEGSMNRKAVRGRLDVAFSTDFLKYATFAGDYAWRPLWNLSEQGRNQNLQQLNLSVGINLLKKDLKIAFRGIDLLRNGSVYAITMGPSSVTHSWTPVYGRYFVLDISYRFNNSGGRSMPRYGI